MLWEELAKLRLEIDTIKIQTQEMEKKYVEDIAIAQEKNACLQKTLRETVFQHNAQLDVLRAELIKLKCKLEHEQENRIRLEAEVESYRCRLATAVEDHDPCQASQRDLPFAFQRSIDEWFSLLEKMNLDMSNVRQNNENLFQRLAGVESKSNTLETELRHVRDSVQERTLVSGGGRDHSQNQCEKEDVEHVKQREQGEVDQDRGEQESLVEKLSLIQNEIVLIRKQLNQAPNNTHGEEKTVINTQHQIPHTRKIFDHENENYVLKLLQMIKEIINEWEHFKERRLQTEKDKGEGDDDDLIAKLPPASSNKEKTPQQEFTVNALLKECEELKAEKDKLKQKVVKLRAYKIMHMAEESEMEKYKLKFEATAKDVADKVKLLDLYLQTQSISRNPGALTCTRNATIGSHLELRTPLSQTTQDEIRKCIRNIQEELKWWNLLERK
ncbi:putative coiled-coil domain-containing protein 144C [Eptesicus fuscus]|uniref:putative coiled-coil domain-containing protein 144C n=1 Tax=Eptesicus fuscus TaxID=29078 RepID=UPI002404370B|nr:putative coiled-coil domain-containing protein 144C [Eptesicus fuscus]